MTSSKSIRQISLGSDSQALVEFAFVLPLLLILMVAIVDMGIIFFIQITVTNAAWEGARAGATIVDPDQGDQEIIGAVQTAAYGLDLTHLAVDIDPGQNEPPRNRPYPFPRGESLTVTVVYQVDLSFLGLAIPVTGQAVTRMEYQNPR